MSYTYEIDNTKKYPNIIIEKRYKDSVLKGYRFTAENGYTLAENIIELDENNKEIEKTVYSEAIYTPANYNFDNFCYKAVMSAR